jgi:hypothetical protein
MPRGTLVLRALFAATLAATCISSVEARSPRYDTRNCHADRHREHTCPPAKPKSKAKSSPSRKSTPDAGSRREAADPPQPQTGRKQPVPFWPT